MRHSTITDPAIHEPKGVSTAAAGTVYTANGSGSGAWSTPPSGIAGSIVKSTYYPSLSSTTGTTTTPFDNTIPQIGEGTEFLTASFTPTTSGNKVRVEVSVIGSYSVAAKITAALFKDGATNAVAATVATTGTTNETVHHHLIYEFTTASASAITFALRIGGSTAGTYTLNGNAGTALFGGVCTSSLLVSEIKV